MSNYFWNILARLAYPLFWERYKKQASALGLREPVFVLSFDCDTDADAEATVDILEWLTAHDIKISLAVPGEQLLKHADLYRAAAEHADFINHGARPHAEWHDGRYWSTTFYDQMSVSDVVNDIVQGHRIVCDTTGKIPRGFRAPHFAHVQHPRLQRKIHHALRKLKYAYSSSTLPREAFFKAPIYKIDEIYEIPVTGRYNAPFNVFDSWSHVHSPEFPTILQTYPRRLQDTVDALQEFNIPAILNYYVDPSHVIKQPLFYETLLTIQEQGILFYSFEDVLVRLHLIEQPHPQYEEATL
ncbi:polysaccharide deacetylase family protein [candidate division KSB1 bacterium]|nr:polysaccharide deacetylase family protein [candidate division KSB1 bacterium]